MIVYFLAHIKVDKHGFVTSHEFGKRRRNMWLSKTLLQAHISVTT